MPYIAVRGNLGLANTRVYGLTNHEIDKMSEILRMTSRADEKCEVVYYNAAMYLINQLEYHLGYRVVAMATTEEQLTWTLFKISDSVAEGSQDARVAEPRSRGPEHNSVGTNFGNGFNRDSSGSEFNMNRFR